MSALFITILLSSGVGGSSINYNNQFAEISPQATSEDVTISRSFMQNVAAGSEEEEEEEEEEAKEEEEEDVKQEQEQAVQGDDEKSKIKEICNDGIDNDDDGDVDLEDSDCEDEEEKDKPTTDIVASTETTVNDANNVGQTEPTNDNQTPTTTTTTNAEDISSIGSANKTNTSSVAPPLLGLQGFTAGTQPLNGNTYNIEGTGTTIQYPPDFTPIRGVALNNENTVDTDVLFTKKTAGGTNTIDYGVSVWNINDFPPALKEKYDTPEEIYESLLNYPHRSNKFILRDSIEKGETSVFGKPGGRFIEYKYDWCLEGLCPPAIPYQEKIRQEYRVEGNTIYLTTYRVNQGILDNLADIDIDPQTKSAFDLYRVNAEQIGASFKSVAPPPPPPPPPSKETICDDGKDNDADRLVDAADPDCLKTVNAPQAIAVIDKTTARVGEAVQLDGSGSKDSAGGTNLDYQWTQASGKSKPTFSMTDPKPKFIVPAIPDGATTDTLTFQLTVNDKGKADAKSQPSNPVTVTVNSVTPPPQKNNPPVAKGTASPSTVNEGATVKLDASQSTDSDIGDTLTYLWSQTAPQIPVVELSSTTAIGPTFKAPEVSSDTSFTFLLTVKDKAGLTSNTNIPVKVLNAKPLSEPGGGGGSSSTGGSSAGAITDGGTTTGKDAGLLETGDITTDILDGNFSLYENHTLKFKIQYPSNWIKLVTGSTKIPVIFTVPQPNDTTTRQTSSQQQLGLSAIELPNLLVNVENVSSDISSSLASSSQQQEQNTSASTASLLHQFAINQTTNLFNSKSTLFQLLQSNSTASLANNSAYKLVYNGTKLDDNTTKVKGFNIFTIKDGKAYSLSYLAKAEEYDKYLPVIQNMIDSFQITNSNSAIINSSTNNDIPNSSLSSSLIPSSHITSNNENILKTKTIKNDLLALDNQISDLMVIISDNG